MGERGLRLGLVGLGTIGTGVVRLLQSQGPAIAQRLGTPLELVRIADVDLERDRAVALDAYALTRDWREVVADPDIDLVIELIGGTGVARDVVLAALAARKDVVTANKALLSVHGPELFASAAENGVDIAFEASVAGTIPVLRALREGLCADRIEAVHGIVNGTCNFILSEMDAGGDPYAACLKRAQELGYAEADPTLDVSGSDSAQKLAILLGLALGVHLDPADLPTEGIERVSPIDMEFARQFGLRIKLLAMAKEHEGAVEARVGPTMIPASSVLAGVAGAMNAVEVRGRHSGPTLYYGAGAGALPTASAVLGDVMELGRNRRLGISGRVPPLGTPSLRETRLRSPEEIEAEYYLRFAVLDKPGVLASITGVLGNLGISIASVVQPERHASEAVPVVIMTHRAREASVQRARARIETLGEVRERAQLIRIEREL